MISICDFLGEMEVEGEGLGRGESSPAPATADACSEEGVTGEGRENVLERGVLAIAFAVSSNSACINNSTMMTPIQ